MNASIFSVVLASAMFAVPNVAPTWQVSYMDGLTQATVKKKPLVVIFGSGATAWTKVVRDGNPTEQIMGLLNDQYVCVYVDVATPAGKKLAQSFAITGSVGVVISDRTGSTQAFWHQGDMTNATFTTYLQKYADPQQVVISTETIPSTRTSNSSPISASSPPASTSTLNLESSSPFDSYCPSCQNVQTGRRRR